MSSWDIEVCHDTTMWNEGFEHAAEPFTVLVAPTEQVAKDVSAWLDSTYALENATRENWDKVFITRIHPTGGSTGVKHPVVNLAHAQAVVPNLLAQWRGL